MMDDTGLKIENDIQQLKEWKTKDKFLMQEIESTGLFTKYELKDINTARLHIQVVMLSDVTTSDGKNFQKKQYKD